MRTIDLWWLLRRRSADDKDPQGLTNVLAVIAFAATTAILLVVVGGFGAFLSRAGGVEGMREGVDATVTAYETQYPLFAGIASLLLLIPLLAFNLAGGTFIPTPVITLPAIAFGMLVAGIGAAALVYLFFEFRRITRQDAEAAARASAGYAAS